LPGDLIIAVNDNKIELWQEFVNVIQANTGNKLVIHYERNGIVQVTQVVPEYDARANRGIVGIMPQIDNFRPGVIESTGLAFRQTYLVASSMITSIAQMVTGQVAAEVAGPIGVAQMAGEVAQLGIIPLLQFAAFLSINLGLINLLPVPVLDGGHVVTLVVEGLRGKPLNKNKMQFIQMIGFALLLMLMLVATFKDIIRLKLF
jgi:regulator of sigma E protease